MPSHLCRRFRSLLPVLLLAAACTPAAAADLDTAFQAALDSLRLELGFPGATAAYVLPDGHGRAFATGWSDSAAGVPMAADHRMPAGSVGKSFVGAVAAALILEGRLDPAATLDTWLAEEPWFDRLRRGREVTLRMLLTHTSGVPDHLADPAFLAKIGALAAPGGDPDAVLTPRECIAHSLDRDFNFPPGERFGYTDTNYLLVGLIIERVTGRAFYDEVRGRFLAPLGLALTLPADRRDLPHLAQGHMQADNPFGLPETTLVPDGRMNHNPALEWTGGGFVSNPLDLARWARTLYTGRALPGPYLDLLLDAVDWDPEGPGYDAYGLAVIVDDSGDGVWWGHSGWYPGYNTFMTWWPAEQCAVAVQVNRDYRSGARAVAMRLARLVREQSAAGN